MGEFDSNIETWESYTERLTQYFIANEIGDEKKIACFLTIIGPKTYALFKNLCAPDKSSTKSYDDFSPVKSHAFGVCHTHNQPVSHSHT